LNKEQLQEHRRERLMELAIACNGYASLGRMLGYRDGAFISQLCKGIRPISEDFVRQCEELHGFAGWFHAYSDVSDLFTPELLHKLREMPAEDRKRMENLLRSALAMPVIR